MRKVKQQAVKGFRPHPRLLLRRPELAFLTAKNQWMVKEHGVIA